MALPLKEFITFTPHFAKSVDEVGELSTWSLGATMGPELSEHPNSTNAILAISNKAQDRIFMTFPFLMICGRCILDSPAVVSAHGEVADNPVQRAVGGLANPPGISHIRVLDAIGVVRPFDHRAELVGRSLQEDTLTSSRLLESL